jgi:osmotically-inducible protein OsmY
MPRTYLDDGRIEFRPRATQSAPPGVARNDRRIRDRLREQLGRAGIDLGDVAITVASGIVRLVGSVPTARLKRAIEETAARCVGVRNVDTRIRVRRNGIDRSV